MRLSRARTGQGPLDHDVQWDGGRAPGRLYGRALRVEQRWYGMGQRVGVGMLMVKVVGVNVLAGRGGGFVSWQGRGGRESGQLETQREAAVLLCGERGGGDGVARSRVLCVAFCDRGGPLRGHGWRRFDRMETGPPRALSEVTCQCKNKTDNPVAPHEAEVLQRVNEPLFLFISVTPAHTHTHTQTLGLHV